MDEEYNGLTLCTGSLGSDQKNEIPDIIEAARGRVPFAHVRNLKYNSPGDFEEAAHLSSDGSMDMYEILRKLYAVSYTHLDVYKRQEGGKGGYLYEYKKENQRQSLGVAIAWNSPAVDRYFHIKRQF